MVNPTKNFVPPIEHQQQLKGVRKRKIIFVDPQCHRLFANESELRKYCRINHHKPKFLCSVDGNYVEKDGYEIK